MVKTHSDILEDPLFGRLEWDPVTQWWEGSVPALGGERFHLSVQPRSMSDRSISDAARQVFAALCMDLEGIRLHALRQFFSDTHGRIGDITFSLDELVSDLRPDGIMVESDGYFEASFADQRDRILAGSHIVVSRFWPNGTREVVFEG